MAALRADRQKVYVRRMCDYLRQQFPAQLLSLDEQTLQAKVAETLQRSADYGLTADRDCCRFLNLAAAWGWNFELEPENVWMREFLTDPDVSDPSQRLHLLVEECIRRIEIEEANRRIAQEFGLT